MSEEREDLEAAMRALLEEELVTAGSVQAGAGNAAACAQGVASPIAAERASDKDEAAAGFRNAIASIAAEVLKIPSDRLDPREALSRYGVDSIIVTEIMRRVSDRLALPIAPTVFFEARHLDELADILFERYGTAARIAAPAGDLREAAPANAFPAEPEAADDGDAARWIAKVHAIAAGKAAPAPPGLRSGNGTGYEPIAILAMDGAFAESATLDDLARHLAQGDDCIREVPPARWDWRAVDGDPRQGEWTDVRYGGFAPDVDLFDPLFFGMSARETELMDPQHRMFIQCVWRTIEMAGYAPRSLSGRKVGLFLGVNLQDYAHLIDRAGAIEAAHLTSLGHMFCPNRISFLLDIHGPSQVIDTACSSSLVALHRAVLALQHEGCEMAIAGGANLMLSPDMHIMYSKLGMICADGRCKTFSDKANGYARGDGVGAVLLKPLAQAERDGDPILAVIRGSAENHGGLSTSLTAPNPRAQARLVLEAHRKAGTDPRTVGYIECHGTGTALGDPIEVNGLKMAFDEMYGSAGLAMPERASCGLGSVKSNIGHAETAAGIAGVIKTVLALRHRRLYRTLHADALNPMLALEGSPFFVLQDGETWEAPVVDGVMLPRRAGVSSFGAGGSNAHVVIEEYAGRAAPPASVAAPVLVVLSAKSEDRLAEAVRNLLAFVAEIEGTAETPALSDIAYTLQVGRDAMEHRLALVVASLAELRTRLARLGEASAEAVPACARGVVKRKGGAPRSGNGALPPGSLDRAVADRDLARLAALWVAGVEIDWPRLYTGAARPQRVALPAYPFARQRHWLAGAVAGRPERRRAGSRAALHPLCQQNTSDLDGVRFTSSFTGREPFLADHVVMGETVLPGVAYLEMARAAAVAVRPAGDGDASRFRIGNVVWARPFAVGDRPASLSVALTPADGGRIAYRIVSGEGGDAEALHSQGTIAFGIDRDDGAERLDLGALRARIAGAGSERNCLVAADCYAAFSAMGLAYGPSHQGLERVSFAASRDGRPEVLAEIAVPAAGRDADRYVLAPGLMDSALQACIGLVAAAGGLPNGDGADAPQAALPFGLDSLDVLGPLSERMWVWVRHAARGAPRERLQKLDLDMCDAEGRIVVRFCGLSSRAIAPAAATERSAVLIGRPVWQETLSVPTPASVWGRHRVVLCDLDGALRAGLKREIERAIPGATCLCVPLTGDGAQWYGEATARVLRLLKHELLDNDAPRTLVQVVVPAEGDGALLEGLSGLVKTVNRESSRVVAQLVAVDAGAQADLAARLAAEAGSGETHVRLRGDRREAMRWEETVLSEAGAAPWKDSGVYLVTGGSGGLGALFARAIAAATRRATVILCGRSAPGPQQTDLVDALVAAGANAHYRQADVARRADVDALVGDLLRTYGRLDGVLHCAGLLRDNFLARKPLDEVADVLAPKVSGTLNLDAATADLDLDFLALFSSAAGAFGSAGQADYAAANAFLDAFAHRRQQQVAAGQRRGRTVSINWPLWAGGGMQMEPAALAMMRQSMGMEPLPDDVGLAAFRGILAADVAQASVLYGRPDRFKVMLAPPVPVAADAREPDDKAAEAPPVAPAALQGRVAEILLGMVGRLAKFDLSDLDADAEWSEYGFDSIALTDFANQLNQGYRLDLTPTVFFEHPTVAALARWMAETHVEQLARALGLSLDAPDVAAPKRRVAVPEMPAPEAAPRVSLRQRSDDAAVAIVGMSGSFPMAPDLDAFWQNLAAGRDCITEIPPERWDWRALGDETTVKWGGFIAGVGDFDARFFNISPREAELMDPAQRLLLVHVWKAIEDAGYAPKSLSGSRTGVFVGTASSGYGALAARAGAAIESLSATGEVGSIGPNRLSYLLNLTGPSEPVETACSSSLVAIHRALAAIAHGDCDQAIVGGINLILSPETHISFSKAGMLSPDGRCKAFAEGANGYVRGEGVGMLLLKPLAAAEAAGDPIRGVIRASAENHGGRANSLTAPNPKAQAALIKSAYEKAGIDPATVGYIEAHGTGTSLGDPIEIAGLTSAFRELAAARGTPEPAAGGCGLGSVKSNIGHLELAAGIAGVLKVLLQLEHGTLAPSLHCETVNPHIHFEASPFYLVRESRPWEAPVDARGGKLPRRAGVSSFGFGGVNAHVLIEEYRAPEDAAADRSLASDTTAPLLFVLSARNADRLNAYAADVRAFVARHGARGAASAADVPVRPDVLQRTCALAAEILGVDVDELAPDQSLDGYGFDRMHRARLHEKLSAALGADLVARVFFDNHTLAEIARAVAGDVSGAKPTCDARPWLDVADLVYTFQVGREAMEARLAFAVRSLAELDEKLGAFLEGTSLRDDAIHTGQKSKALAGLQDADLDLGAAIARWMANGQTGKLLDLWVQGLEVDWTTLYGAGRCYPEVPRRIPVPGYPFAAQRHWISVQGADARAPSTGNGAPAVLHPLLHRNVSGLGGIRFATRLSGREFFLADHRVKGQRVLPGVAYLEMARAAVALASPHAGDAAGPDAIVVLRDVAWIRPAVVEAPLEVSIALTPTADGTVRFEITSGDGEGQPVHSVGSVGRVVRSRPMRIETARLAAQAGVTRHDARDCYALFETCGLSYGPGHRGIVALHACRDGVLAELALPASVSETGGQYVLHPAILDSALQASIGLMLAAGSEGREAASPKLALPFAVEEVAVYGGAAPARWAWVRPAAGSGRSTRIQKLDIDVADEAGEVLVAIRGFSSRLLDVAPGDARMPVASAAPVSSEPQVLRGKTAGVLKEHLSAVLKFPIADIHEDEPLDSYGIDSMLVVELTGRLESVLGPLSKTLFFEHGTLGELVDHLVEAYRPQLLKFFDADLPRAREETRPEAIVPAPAVRPAPAAKAAAAAPPPSSSPLDIAIIGVSGRYPEAPDVEAYWRNLRDGRDCIREVPPERWDWRAYCGTDGTAAGQHTCKWGGFIADADKFDPLFFNISPTTAEYMDPQERLFLEHAWMAMEDAGYRRADLSAPGGHTGDEDEETATQVGVYAGVMYGEYQLLACEASLAGRGAPSTNFYASVANRVSYALNLQGPSLAVDTMCSSSLTAIHIACLDLKLGRTDMGLAGGVNLSLHPKKYELLSAGQFISTQGKCHSFGADGDGYVPSEGVGVVLLKRLADAERDGDRIYGVIKASALNHGGKTNGYSVPNPKAQQAVISRALRESGIDPRAFGYVEAHGTGTRLGDPIEIAGLGKALARHFAPGQRCWIGSSKSNIGHSEAAAGIAGLTKVLMQMRERQIAPSLHSERLNPNIDFSATPFAVNQELRDWSQPVADGQPLRRVAGISSFGAGGANAHVIVEEYPGPEISGALALPAAEAPCAIVLSARTEAQLAAYAERLRRFVWERGADARRAPALRDVAFTLQLGREAMPYRLGFVARSLPEVADRLDAFLAGDGTRVLAGRAAAGGRLPAATPADPASMLRDWIDGAPVDWRGLYGEADPTPVRIGLPTYPFARERYWTADLPPRPPAGAVAASGSKVAADATLPTQDVMADVLLLRPAWAAEDIDFAIAPPVYEAHRVFALADLPAMPGIAVERLRSGGAAADACFSDYAVALFAAIKEMLAAKPVAPVLVQVVVGVRGDGLACLAELCAALAALLKTARLENPRLVGQLIEIDGALAEAGGGALADVLRSNGRAPSAVHVRYRGGRREVAVLAEADAAVRSARPAWREGGSYLVTGGAGGLGLIFAREIARQVKGARLVLTGRSEANAACRAAVAALAAEGADARYRAVDVCDRGQVEALVASIGTLHGIIHSAGVLRDAYILKKTAEDVRAVLAPKVAGVVNLDLATRGRDLDFLALFASLAGVTGNPGQADYATANAFLDGYAAYRNRLAREGAGDLPPRLRPRGVTLSIDWPLWRDGGMQLDAAAREAMWRAAGLRPLETEAGLAAFAAILAAGGDRAVVLQGDLARVRTLFLPTAGQVRNAASEPATSREAPPARASCEAGDGPLVRETGTWVARTLSELLKLPLHRLEGDVPLDTYGIDSVAMMRITAELEKVVGPLSKTLLFEHPTIDDVSRHLAETCAPALTQLFDLAAGGIRDQQRDDEGGAARSPAGEKVAEGLLSEAMPLSEGQQGLWLLHQIAPAMGAYNVPLVLRLGPAIDLEILRRAFAHVLRRFPALRTVFREADGVPTQAVRDDPPLRFDVEAMAPASPEEILAVLRARSKAPFDLAQGPLLRVLVLSPGEEPRYVLVVVHHIVFDGMSGVLLARALAEAYVALAAGEAPALPEAQAGYGDFVRWQRDLMQSPRGAAQLRYWTDRLAGPLSMLALPLDRCRPSMPGFNGASHDVMLGETEAGAVRALARAARVSVATAFLGALKLLLHRYSSETDVIVGMPTLGRPEPRFEAVVGYFVNMIAVRTREFAGLETTRFLARLQGDVAEGLDNADYPFPAVLAALDIDRGQSRSPLTQVLFSFQNFIRPDDRAAADRGAQGDHAMALVAGVNQEGGHDLALDVYEADGGFRLIFSYDSDLFDAETIRRAAGHYVRFLQAMASSPHAALSAHAFLPEEERRLLEDWSNGPPAVVRGGSVVDLVAEQAARTPDAPAVLFQGEVLSYRDLVAASARLSRALGAGARIGVCLSRGPGLVVAMLAIWRAGSVYVPVAPDCPAERIALLMADCGAALLIVDAATRARCAAAGVALLSLDAEDRADAAEVPPARPCPPDAPAYVIYTSGSTGRPKGVVVSHGALAQHCQVMRDVYRLVPEDRILQFASAAVDASLEQILPGLIAGAAIVVRPDPLWSAAAFCREADRFGLTVIDVPPSYLHEVLRDGLRDGALAAVRLVITGGEALRPDTVALWMASPLAACRFVNAYGPTETTITSTLHEVGADAAGPTPIGRPLPGECAVILDGYGEPAPIGVAGELHIGGGGLAIGYLGEPEATQAVFADSPAGSGRRLYRTGDAACWRADGTIAFLGRRDHQVKVRGYRVECGEVEAALRALDGVQDAAVVHRDGEGGAYLAAFLVPRAGTSLTADEVRRALVGALPDFMVPAQVVMLSEMPWTPGGKVDRPALARRDLQADAGATYVAPRTEIEARLAELWQRVLGKPRVGVRDNFFDLGGHSLLAVRLGAEIRKALGREIAISSLFEAPDIARQAVLLAAGEGARSPLVMLERGGAGDPVFLVHAVSGAVLPYRALARLMGARRPVYALEAPDASRHPGSIEGLAALYVAAMRSARPRGPYHVGGWSMGGVIAFEMARQLAALGEPVAMLALIDSYTPEAARAIAGALDDEETLRRTFAREMGLSGDMSADAEALFPVYCANVAAMQRYAPSSYSGRASLLVAEAPATDVGRHGDWDARVLGGLSTLAVPGDHHTLLAPPNVSVLAGRLMQLMDDAGAA